MATLFKTTIEIWSDYNPDCVEPEDLFRDTENGPAILGASKIEEVLNVENDENIPDGVVEFFGIEQDEVTSLLRETDED